MNLQEKDQKKSILYFILFSNYNLYIFSSYPTINLKKLDTDFNNLYENHKKLNKQYECSELKIRIPKIIGHEFDTTMYNRVKYIIKFTHLLKNL